MDLSNAFIPSGSTYEHLDDDYLSLLATPCTVWNHLFIPQIPSLSPLGFGVFKSMFMDLPEEDLNAVEEWFLTATVRFWR